MPADRAKLLLPFIVDLLTKVLDRNLLFTDAPQWCVRVDAYCACFSRLVAWVSIGFFDLLYDLSKVVGLGGL